MQCRGSLRVDAGVVLWGTTFLRPSAVSFVQQSDRDHRLHAALADADPSQHDITEIREELPETGRLYGRSTASRIWIPFITPVRFEAGAQ